MFDYLKTEKYRRNFETKFTRLNDSPNCCKFVEIFVCTNKNTCERTSSGLFKSRLAIPISPFANPLPSTRATVSKKLSLFFGFTMPFYSKSEWETTLTILMFMMNWSERIIQNYMHLLTDTRPTHTVNVDSFRLLCLDLKLTPTEKYDVILNPR